MARSAYQELIPSTSDSSLLQDGASSPADKPRIFVDMSLVSPYTVGASSRLAISDRFLLPPDPEQWGCNLHGDFKESDDDLHNPDIRVHRPWRPHRGLGNLACLLLVCFGLVALFAGYPIVTYFTRTTLSNQGGFNLGGINASGQIPKIPHMGLIDDDTPQDAFVKGSWNGGPNMQLVFSDEFNTPGRTFWPGDDPYWEAVNLHYWETNDLEWYNPEAITTKDGYLVVTLSQKETHDLNFEGGMMSTWNKFCFTGGYIEASVSLPGVNNVAGFWPSIWTLGNLGRVGYGASVDGLWPYTYDACDVGTVANQSVNGQPIAATEGGDESYGGVLSYLPGQRLSRCTCSGESHPGPLHADGTFVGRGAPEIDMFEAQVKGNPRVGEVSQSAQWGPFNAGYVWQNTSDNEIIPNPSITAQNAFAGSVLQQATSVVTKTNPDCYEGETGCFSVYGFEYVPGFDNAYITWIADNQVSWTLNVAGLGADPIANISARPVSQEPMYIIVNMGMSTSFSPVNLLNLPFPAHMRVDYIRVYQPQNAVNIGCDPPDFPTAAYINTYIEAYTNPNLTTWTDDYLQPVPKNSFLGQC